MAYHRAQVRSAAVCMAQVLAERRCAVDNMAAPKNDNDDNVDRATCHDGDAATPENIFRFC